MSTLNVAVLMGGASAEAEVSRASAAQVCDALVDAGHDAATIELDADCAAALLGRKPDVVFPAGTYLMRVRFGVVCANAPPR